MSILLLFISLISYKPVIYSPLKVLSYNYVCEFQVTSHNRTIGHNIYVKGSPRSYHLMKDRALDIVKTKNCKYDYIELGFILKMYYSSVIVYDNHIHIDNRPYQLFIIN